MSAAVLRNSWHGLWNFFQQPFFAQLSLTARLHPLSAIRGRRRIVIGRRTQIGAHCQLDAQTASGSIRIGDHCQLGPSAMLLAHGGAIELGDDCSVNPFCVLYGHGGLKIGNGVRIAAGTVIIPANHNFDEPDVPIHQQGVTAQGIVIEDDVWIGANVTVLDGVRLGHGSVIAAGAVVNHDVQPFSVMGGVPARLLKQRGSPAQPGKQNGQAISKPASPQPSPPGENAPNQISRLEPRNLGAPIFKSACLDSVGAHADLEIGAPVHGQGETRSVLGESPGGTCNSNAAAWPERALVTPSPGGEGRGEGEPIGDHSRQGP